MPRIPDFLERNPTTLKLHRNPSRSTWTSEQEELLEIAHTNLELHEYLFWRFGGPILASEDGCILSAAPALKYVAQTYGSGCYLLQLHIGNIYVRGIIFDIPETSKESQSEPTLSETYISPFTGKLM